MSYTIEIGRKFSLEQSLMLISIIDRMKERGEGWSTELAVDFPPLTTIHEKAILGSFAWSLPTSKHKIIKRSNALDIGGGWCTPGDVSRDYLAIKFPKRRMRCTTSQWKACVQDKRNTPVYCEPCTLTDAVYIDLTSAYWQVLKACGWDVNYNPSKFLGVESDVNDFPLYDHKLARNCLVSVGLPSEMRIWTGEKLIFQKKPNRFINFLLWRLVMDVLNGVAYDLIIAGAKYVYTDGYIFETHRRDAAFNIIGEWGLEAGIKYSGEVDIKAPAAYKFPEYETKPYKRSKHIPFDKVYDPDIDWLKWRFRKFVDKSKKSGG